MNTVYLILLLLGAVCFFLSAVTSVSIRGVNILSAGLFFWVLVPLIQIIRVM